MSEAMSRVSGAGVDPPVTGTDPITVSCPSVGVQISGTRPSLPGPLAPTEQVVGVAMGRFDGHGGYTQVGSTHGSSSGVTSGTPATGSYVVNADCTGVVTFQNAGQPFAIQVAIVVVGQGEEVKGATTDPPGVMVTAVWRKK